MKPMSWRRRFGGRISEAFPKEEKSISNAPWLQAEGSADTSCQGHIDGTGRVASLVREENAVWVRIDTSDKILRYIIEKGSVAIDGISLTVAEVGPGYFKVSVIPHTGEETTLLSRRPGDVVNLENDVVGKYVERLLTFDSGEERSSGQESSGKKRGIDLNMLSENGFL